MLNILRSTLNQQDQTVTQLRFCR